MITIEFTEAEFMLTALVLVVLFDDNAKQEQRTLEALEMSFSTEEMQALVSKFNDPNFDPNKVFAERIQLIKERNTE